MRARNHTEKSQAKNRRLEWSAVFIVQLVGHGHAAILDRVMECVRRWVGVSACRRPLFESVWSDTYINDCIGPSRAEQRQQQQTKKIMCSLRAAVDTVFGRLWFGCACLNPKFSSVVLLLFSCFSVFICVFCSTLLRCELFARPFVLESSAFSDFLPRSSFNAIESDFIFSRVMHGT